MQSRMFLFLLLMGLPATAAPPVYTRDIAPILYKHCASCHRPGEFAPFSVLSYRDVSQHARSISRAVSTRRMPPWLPEHGYADFADERRLTASEIATIGAWTKAGAPEGDPKWLPPTPSPPAEDKPDAVFTMPKPYTIAAHSDDDYRCFVIPLRLEKSVFVRAVEFEPSNRKVVHHALLFADSSGTARKNADASGSYQCFGTPGFLPSASFGGWTPGSGPVRMPDGAAVRVRAGSDLVVQMHFHSRAVDEREQSSVALWFTDQAPTRAVVDVGLVSRNIDIPAGDPDYVVRDHFTIPVDVHAIGIIPHAHYVCREMKGWATLPNGRKQWLIWIRNWDFNWQQQYRYAKPVALPAGTRVEMEFTYDNSGANPHNPNVPPKRVMWGPASTDEMAGLHIQVIPDRMEELHELGQALWGKIMRMVGGGFYRRPE